MLGEAIPTALPQRLIVASDAFAFADPEVAQALRPIVEKLKRLIGEVRDEVMTPGGIVQWARAQRTIQPAEAWLTFRDWIERCNPRLAYNVARNIYTGSQITEGEQHWAELTRREARGRMRHLLPPGTMLCLPTTPFPAPKRGEPLSVASVQRDRILCLCAHGGLTGVPQVSIPGATVDGLPVGLSIVAGQGSDAALVATAAALAGG
jgi:amidase